MISIIPLTYLFSLALMVTPITIFLIIQVVNFNKQQLFLSKDLILEDEIDKNHKNQYQIANIYINRNSWRSALTILQNEVYLNSDMNKYWLAKYHNATGFILEQVDLNKMSLKHYLFASNICPEYQYASKNLNRLDVH